MADEITFAMVAALATTTEAEIGSALDDDPFCTLYSSAREVSAFDTAAAAAASSALCLTASSSDASRVHVRSTGPSDDAEVPTLHNALQTIEPWKPVCSMRYIAMLIPMQRHYFRNALRS